MTTTPSEQFEPITIESVEKTITNFKERFPEPYSPLEFYPAYRDSGVTIWKLIELIEKRPELDIALVEINSKEKS